MKRVRKRYDAEGAGKMAAGLAILLNEVMRRTPDIPQLYGLADDLYGCRLHIEAAQAKSDKAVIAEYAAKAGQLIRESSKAIDNLPFPLPVIFGSLQSIIPETYRADNSGMKPESIDELLTVPEAARRMELSTSTIYESTRNGTLPFVRKGGGPIKIQSSVVSAYLTLHPAEASGRGAKQQSGAV